MELIERILAFEGQEITLGNMDDALLMRDARECIESLRAVAQAADALFLAWHDGAGYDGTDADAIGNLRQALDACPPWALDNESE